MSGSSEPPSLSTMMQPGLMRAARSMIGRGNIRTIRLMGTSKATSAGEIVGVAAGGINLAKRPDALNL